LTFERAICQAPGLNFGKRSLGDWRELRFNQGIEPPSWVLADDAIAASAMGILFASIVAPGGTNLVIYTQRLGPLDLIEVHDPAGALPKNQDSWR
jgi:RES domain-containing protein